MPWRTVDGSARSPTRARRSWRRSSRASSRSAASSTSCATSTSSRSTARTVPKKMAAYHQYWAVNKAVEATVGGRVRRPSRRRRLAHAGQRQEPLHGVLLRQARAAAGDGEPDARRAHRPQRPGRPAVRHLRRLPRAAAPDAGAGREPRRPARASCRSPPAASSSPPSRSSCPTSAASRIRCSATARTSSSSPTRRTAASTTSSTASRATCATRCRTPRSSASPARPSSSTDKNTRAVFGDYIDTYDIQRAVEDGATVPIFYEGRLAKIDLPEEQKPVVDAEFEEVTEAAEVAAPREAQEQVGARRGDGRHRPAAGAGRQGPGRALRGASGRRPGDADEGHGRVHEPAHLRRPLRRDREAAAGVARRRRQAPRPTTRPAPSRS